MGLWGVSGQLTHHYHYINPYLPLSTRSVLLTQQNRPTQTMAFLVVFVFSMLLGSGAGLFTLENNCSEPIWPVVRPRGENLINLTYDNIHLLPGERVNVPTPPTWFGQVSARTGCSFDQGGIGANCTTGTLPPITVVEFLLSEMQNRYYVSVVDGFNLPVSVMPSGGSGDCQPVGCPTT